MKDNSTRQTGWIVGSLVNAAGAIAVAANRLIPVAVALIGLALICMYKAGATARPGN